MVLDMKYDGKGVQL